MCQISVVCTQLGNCLYPVAGLFAPDAFCGYRRTASIFLTQITTNGQKLSLIHVNIVELNLTDGLAAR